MSPFDDWLELRDRPRRFSWARTFKCAAAGMGLLLMAIAITAINSTRTDGECAIENRTLKMGHALSGWCGIVDCARCPAR
jgi:hypothetical protein